MSKVSTARAQPETWPNLSRKIIAHLARGTGSTETITNRVGSTLPSVRSELSRLANYGFVTHDGRIPRTWSLTEQGRAANALC
jgi:predicted transcriptional regulator